MAQTENGHCSTCQVQNSASSCGGSAQSFKRIVGSSTVENHEKYLKLKSLIPQINKGTDLITKEVWDQITEILQALKDYGQIDEFNPTQEKINNTIVNKGNPVFLDNYNTILTALDRNNISGSQIVTQELIDNLKTYINKYELDATRCDVCNTSGCQVPQCCDSNCHSDPCYGGGGGCATHYENVGAGSGNNVCGMYWPG